MNTRRSILFALLAATLAAVWWVSGEEGGDAESGGAVTDLAVVRAKGKPRPAAKPGAAKNATVGVALPPVADAKDSSRFPVGGPDLFPGLSWRPPPPPAPPAALAPPPPPPMAPPLPFKYLGRWADERGETVFLDLGDRMLDVRAGQRLEQWRLDKIGADTLGFTYLPLNQQRQMRLTP